MCGSIHTTPPTITPTTTAVAAAAAAQQQQQKQKGKKENKRNVFNLLQCRIWNTRRTETQIHAQLHRYETHQHSNSKWRHQSALGLVILCVSSLQNNITQFFYL